jgi:polygalacturonase
VALGTDINSGGISNVLVDGLRQRGNLQQPQSAGIQIGSSTANGGVVDRITFQNVCMVNENDSFRFYTNYGCQTGSKIPRYTNTCFARSMFLPPLLRTRQASPASLRSKDSPVT